MRRFWTPALAILAACGDPVGAPTPPPPVGPTPAAAGLEIVASAPVDGATGIARAASVKLAFSAPVDPATIHEATVGLWQEARPIPVGLRVTNDQVELVPRDLLELNATYVVTVRREVQDTAGRPLVREFRLTFMTKVSRFP
jgi:hypothetical protein